MAEVNVIIKAEDRATPVLEGIASKVESAGIRISETLNRKLDTVRSINLDISGALRAVSTVINALESIPDVSYKTVVIEYMTQASPVRPFTEGIRYIRGMMESLPTEGRYLMRYDREDGGRNVPQASATRSGSSVSFAPTIHINASPSGGGANLASSIDRELAELWRHDRSELKREISR